MSSPLTTELYTPLQKWQTRVLRLHSAQRADEPLKADLLRAGLADGPYLMLGMDEPLVQFEAISYTWGDPSSFGRQIVCNGISVSIQPSLHAALRHFRHDDTPRYLWADALCINQSDDAEKSYQVAQCFLIFCKAQRVLAWLGDEGPRTREALEYLRSNELETRDRYWKGDGDRHMNWAISQMTPLLRGALDDLCRRPWGRRVWIQQEVFAARELAIFCGNQKLSLKEYQSILEWTLGTTRKSQSAIDGSEALIEDQRMCKAVSNLSVASGSQLATLREESSLFRHIEEEARFGVTRLSNFSLEKVLLRSSNLRASDPRDHIYALLNLTTCPIVARENATAGGDLEYNGPIGINIDYSRSLSEVFQDVTRFIMNSDRSIAVLELYEPRDSVTEANASLPSWTIDWRCQAPLPEYQDTLQCPESHAYHHRGDRPWTWQYPNLEGTIHLGGFLLAIVSLVNVELSSSLIPDSLKHEMINLRIHLETHSHITIDASAIDDNAATLGENLLWTEARHHTRYHRTLRYKEYRSRPKPPAYIDPPPLDRKHFEMLKHVRPNDVLAHIDGMSGRLVFLRSMPGDTFSFVTIVYTRMLWEALTRQPLEPPSKSKRSLISRTKRPPRWDENIQIYPKRASQSLQDVLIIGGAPHRNFIIC